MALVTFAFVDSIASSPTTRLDLNDGVIFRTLLEDLDLSPPPMRKSVSASILTDGATVNASAYENRVVHAKFQIQGTSADNLATQLRALMTELNRAQNIIKYQPGTTPLFFRTMRSPDVEVDQSQQARFRMFVTCSIEAEPFAYGLRVDQSPVTVAYNPAAANGCYLDVNSVTGDVETPAYVAISAATSALATTPSYLAVRRHGTPSSFPLVYQAESATVGADTTVAASNDATASGAGNNYVTTTFAGTPTSANRLTVAFTAGNQVETRGTFRVLARIKKSVSGDTIQMSARTSVFVANTVTLPTGTNWQVVDLGLVQFPLNEDSPTGYAGTYANLASDLTLLLYAERVAGSGTLKIDHVLAVPADEELCVFNPVSIWSGTNALVLDGPNDTMYWLMSGTSFSSISGASRAGSIPMLRPGNNRMVFVENITGAVLGDTSSVTVSYWPRYLVV